MVILAEMVLEATWAVLSSASTSRALRSWSEGLEELRWRSVGDVENMRRVCRGKQAALALCKRWLGIAIGARRLRRKELCDVAGDDIRSMLRKLSKDTFATHAHPRHYSIPK